MKFIKEYNQFISEEVSKNEPIPEIIGVDKGLAIFLIGAPGIGKSYFVRNHIHTKNPNIKDFSTDDVSLLFTKDPNVYYKGRELPNGRTKNASELNIARMEKFMETRQNFIYDTTGAGKEYTDKGFEHIKEIYDRARENGYKIIFIHLLSTLQTSIEQDKQRSRHVDPHYIQWAYAKQMGGYVDGQKVEGNMKRYKELGPDEYYLVTSINKKYKFYKFVGGKLSARRGDRYIVKESVNLESEVDKIINTMLDYIDNEETVIFGSSTGSMTYQDYLDKNDKYKNFKPVIVSKNSTVSRFYIIYKPKNGTYDNLITILDNMQSTIGLLGDEDWVLSDLKISCSKVEYGVETSINSLTYEFTKPSLRKDDIELPDEDDLREEFYKFGIKVNNISIGDEMAEVQFDKFSWDGELNSENFFDDAFSKICDILGFSSYELYYQGSMVDFEY